MPGEGEGREGCLGSVGTSGAEKSDCKADGKVLEEVFTQN